MLNEPERNGGDRHAGRATRFKTSSNFSELICDFRAFSAILLIVVARYARPRSDLE